MAGSAGRPRVLLEDRLLERSQRSFRPSRNKFFVIIRFQGQAENRQIENSNTQSDAGDVREADGVSPGHDDDTQKGVAHEEREYR